MERSRINPLLTTSEVAELLGIAAHTLAVWRCEGRREIPFVKVGRAVRYRLEDVQEYLRRVLQS